MVFVGAFRGARFDGFARFCGLGRDFRGAMNSSSLLTVRDAKESGRKRQGG
jgi:hypothetical protein